MSSSGVDSSQYFAKIAEYQREIGKPMPVVLRAEGRLMAVSLARGTQPYTRGEDWAGSQAQGAGKVERDIRKVYATGGDVFEAMRNKGEEGAADAFYYFHQNGMIGGKRGAQSLMEAIQTPFRALKIEKLNPSHHKSARGRGGRVGGSGKRFKQVVKADTQLEKYIAAKQKMVGFVKAAFATCARLLGGVRGIPGWVTRHRAPGSIRDNTASPTFPYVELTNSVDYADEALSTSAEHEAYRIGQARLTKSMNIVLQKAAEKARLQ